MFNRTIMYAKLVWVYAKGMCDFRHKVNNLKQLELKQLMENIIDIIFWAIALLIIIGFALVFLSLGFAFGDKTDSYEDSEGNIHLNGASDLWNGCSQSKIPSKIDWDDLQ